MTQAWQIRPFRVGDETALRTVFHASVHGLAHPYYTPAQLQAWAPADHDTQAWAGRNRNYLSMPFWVSKLVALATWPLPNAMRPLTVDQVRLLKQDNVVSEAAKSEGRTLAGLGITAPHSAGAIVPGYLERFKAKGQYAHYRG